MPTLRILDLIYKITNNTEVVPEWEYKVRLLDSRVDAPPPDKYTPYREDELLKEMGEDGWELLQLTQEETHSENFVKYYFKRPKIKKEK